MNINQLRSILPILLVIAIFNGCSKNSDDTGTITLNFKGYVDNEELLLSKEYLNHDNQKFRIEILKFYLSNLKLIDKKGEVLVDSVELVIFSESNSTTGGFGASANIEIPVGEYTGLKYTIGLDPVKNHNDPSLFSSSHPLSSFQNMHWDWAMGYFFLRYEGKFATDPDSALTYPFSYHIGRDPYSSEIDLSSETFDISANKTTEIEIKVDVKKLLVGIDMIDFNITHSTSKFDKIEIISNNFVDTFTKF
ncbi:MAG: hypothetical protein COC01_03780 [Bacteroidetes bacterium]|nr:MAG: hypothetical protein COC01_03780 [Bacteroidota bacterium]